MTYVFVPPTVPILPRISEADGRYSPDTKKVNPKGYALMRFYKNGDVGCCVYVMSDGSLQMDYQVNPPIPIVEGVLTIGTPYPAITPDLNQNGLGSSWYNSEVTEYPLSQPQVEYMYLGGHSYVLTNAQYEQLVNAGFGAYIT